jgi:CopG family transcriptional regulator/antitoxin EndoAI
MNRRINITLSEDTLRIMDRVAGKGSRSRLIDHAVREYVAQKNRQSLRKLLAEGAARRAERDRELTQEWLAIDERAWDGKRK